MAGDPEVPGLGGRTNDSAEIGSLGRKQWPVKSAVAIQ